MSPATHNTPIRRRAGGATLLSTALALTLAAGAGGETTPSITATAVPAEVPIGASVAVTGQIGAEGSMAANRPLQLEAAPYPYRSYSVIARSQSAADGSFSFAPAAPAENTQMRVSIAGVPGAVSPIARVTVDPRVALHAASLGPGRERLSIRIEHAGAAASRPTSVFWYLALRHSARFELAASNRSREIAPGVTYASVILDPPAARFAYRVCLNPVWEAAMGPAATHGRCPAQSFRLNSGI